jgi:imidazoleglycerol phosphate dehydratase HisB
MQARTAKIERKTSETDIVATVDLDGSGKAVIETGIGFFDHMLTSLSRHSRIDIELRCKGDLQIDDHHTIEDCALTLGQAIDKALGDRKGIARFAHAYAPLDEALVRTVIDFSGRPFCTVSLPHSRPTVGGAACENLVHFFQSLAVAARMSLHVDLIRGENDHHIFEAAFKSLAIALRYAVARDGGDAVPSTKGVL